MVCLFVKLSIRLYLRGALQLTGNSVGFRLSLVHGSSSYYDYYEDDALYYIVVFEGFLIVLFMMQIYLRSQPEDHTGLDTHCFDISLMGGYGGAQAVSLNLDAH